MSLMNDPIVRSKLPVRPTSEDYPEAAATLDAERVTEAAAQLRGTVGVIDPEAALDYARAVVPEFMQAKGRKIGGVLLGCHREATVPSVTWTVMNESWAVGSLAAMQVVAEAAGRDRYDTAIETTQDQNNQWGRDQWTVRLEILGPSS
jgi:hypothetical protein